MADFKREIQINTMVKNLLINNLDLDVMLKFLQFIGQKALTTDLTYDLIDEDIKVYVDYTEFAENFKQELNNDFKAALNRVIKTLFFCNVLDIFEQSTSRHLGFSGICHETIISKTHWDMDDTGNMLCADFTLSGSFFNYIKNLFVFHNIEWRNLKGIAKKALILIYIAKTDNSKSNEFRTIRVNDLLSILSSEDLKTASAVTEEQDKSSDLNTNSSSLTLRKYWWKMVKKPVDKALDILDIYLQLELTSGAEVKKCLQPYSRMWRYTDKDGNIVQHTWRGRDAYRKWLNSYIAFPSKFFPTPEQLVCIHIDRIFRVLTQEANDG